MKVLHAIRSDGFAGVERHVAVLARAQVALGDEVTVVGGSHVRMAAALGDAGVQFVPGDTLPSVLTALARIGRFVDVVHAHMTAAEFACASASLMAPRGQALVCTRHFGARRGESRLGRLASRFIASRLSEQIAISQYVADRSGDDCVVIYPGVEAVPTPELQRNSEVLVVQRLEPEKHTQVAVDAFAASSLASNGWILRVVGDGSQRAMLETRVRELGLEGQVQFLGMRDNVTQLMLRAGLLIAPCPIEGLGLVVLEAMAAALPVCATTSAGHLETLTPEMLEYGFPPSGVEIAARSLDALASDSALRNTLGKAGQVRQLEFFTPQTQATRTRSVYEHALSPANVRPT
jgi:glycosyltransferase involved in cell wall biosynthesis